MSNYLYLYYVELSQPLWKEGNLRYKPAIEGQGYIFALDKEIR